MKADKTAHIFNVINSGLFIKSTEPLSPKKMIARVIYQDDSEKLKDYMPKVHVSSAKKEAQLFISGRFVRHSNGAEDALPPLDKAFLHFLDYGKNPQQRLVNMVARFDAFKVKRNERPLAVFLDGNDESVRINLLFKHELITLTWDQKKLTSNQVLKSSDQAEIVTELINPSCVKIAIEKDNEHHALLAMLKTLERCSEESDPASTEDKKGVVNYIKHASKHGAHRIPATIGLVIGSASGLAGIILTPCVATVFAASLMAGGASGIAAAVAAVILLAAAAIVVGISVDKLKHSAYMKQGSQSILKHKPAGQAASADELTTP